MSKTCIKSYESYDELTPCALKKYLKLITIYFKLVLQEFDGKQIMNYGVKWSIA